MFVSKFLKWVLVSVVVVLLTACGGGSSGESPMEDASSGEAEVNTAIIEGITHFYIQKDGQSYELIPTDDETQSVSIVDNSNINLSNVTGDDEVPIVNNFQKIKISLDSDNQISVIAIFSEIPDYILSVDSSGENLSYKPFFKRDDGSVSFKVRAEESILPIKSSSTSQKMDKSFQNFNMTESIYKKYFDIEQNNRNQLKINVATTDKQGCTYSYSVRSPNSAYKYMEDSITNENNAIIVSYPQSGLYKFGLYEKCEKLYGLTFEYRRYWTQEVMVHNISIEKELIEKVATEYAPILSYHDDEEYFPVTLEYLLNKESINSELDGEELDFVDIEGGKSVKYDNIQNYMPYNGDTNGFINIANNFTRNSSEQRYRTGSIASSTVYYSVFEKDNQVYINYHMLYSFDPKSGKGTSGITTAAAAHIFDRESMTLVFNKSSFGQSNLVEPVRVIYGAHLEDQTLAIVEEGFFDDTPYQDWNAGRVSVSWGDSIKFHGHPVVSIAKGSHALYPVAGVYEMQVKGTTTNEPAGGTQQIIVPRIDKFGYINQYTLQNLELGNITSNSWNKYLAFSGGWVDVLGFETANFPPFTSREKDPASWANGAYIFDMFDIPDLAKIKQNEIEAFIKDNVHVNQVPVATMQNITVNKNSIDNALTLSGSDADGDSLTYTVVSQPAHGTLSGTAPNVTYTPAADYNGNDSFTFKVNDGTEDSAIATVSITVSDVAEPNQPPIANAGTDKDVDTTVTVPLDGSNSTDNVTYRWSMVSKPTGSRAVIYNATTVKPSFIADIAGSYVIELIVNDGKLDSAPASVTITATGVVEPPIAPKIIDISPISATQGVSTIFTVTGTDLPDTIAISLVGSTSCGTPYDITATSAKITCTPGTVGSQPFYVKAEPGGAFIEGYESLFVDVSIAIAITKSISITSSDDPKDTCESFVNPVIGCEAIVEPGTSYTKTWTFTNGDIDLSNVRAVLDISDPEIITSVHKAMTPTISAGDTGTFSLNITIPDTVSEGIHKGRYYLADSEGSLHYTNGNVASFWYMINVPYNLPAITLQDVETAVEETVFTFGATLAEPLEDIYTVKLSLGDGGGGYLDAVDMLANANRDSFALAKTINTSGNRVYRVAIFKGDTQISSWVDGSYMVTSISSIPQNLKAEQTAEGALLSWDVVEGASNYTPLVSLSLDGTFVSMIANGGSTIETSFLVDKENFSSTKTFYFAVQADSSALSEKVEFVWKDPVVTDIPTNLKTTSSTEGVTLNWDAVASAESYTLMRSLDGILSGSYEEIAGITTNSHFFDASHFLDGEILYFSVGVTGGEQSEMVSTIWEDIAENTSPTASAGVDQTVTEGEEVTLDASESNDTDGSIVSYEWSEGSVVLSTAESFVKSDLSVGTHTITLTVTDDGGATGSDTVVVLIESATPPPSGSNMVKKTGQTKSYNEAGYEVTDGSIKDDGFYQSGVTPSYTRDDAKEVVTDHITGLEWQDDSEAGTVTKQWVTQANYYAGNYTDTSGDTATTYCANLMLDGGGWRVPSRVELRSIAEYGRYNPVINPAFVNVASNYYWSSTSYANGTYDAWIVDFYLGYQDNDDKNGNRYVRCVRAGQ